MRNQDKAGAGRGIVQIREELFKIGSLERIDFLGNDEPLPGHKRQGLRQIDDLGCGGLLAVQGIEIEIPGSRFRDPFNDQIYCFLD